jgi:hypothetical protein
LLKEIRAVSRTLKIAFGTIVLVLGILAVAMNMHLVSAVIPITLAALTMKGYTGPVETDLEPLISQVVKEFAKKHKLTPTLGYHGEPRWIIHQEVEEFEKFFREVQIAVFSTAGKKLLFFMPQAYQFQGAGMKATRPKPAQMVQYPLDELLPPKGASACRKKIRELLAEAWETVKKFTPNDLIS